MRIDDMKARIRQKIISQNFYENNEVLLLLKDTTSRRVLYCAPMLIFRNKAWFSCFNEGDQNIITYHCQAISGTQ